MSGVDHQYRIAQAVQCRIRQRARRIGSEAQIIRRSRHPFVLRELPKSRSLRTYTPYTTGAYTRSIKMRDSLNLAAGGIENQAWRRIFGRFRLVGGRRAFIA